MRLAAFQWLRAQVDVHGEVLPRSILAEGFVFDGRRVPLLGPQGIFKPAIRDAPLSITTIPGQYPDQMGVGRLSYAYRGIIRRIRTAARWSRSRGRSYGCRSVGLPILAA